ncbi:MAG: M16 family metallopeptidase [Flavobacteriaceae bacterium]
MNIPQLIPFAISCFMVFSSAKAQTIDSLSQQIPFDTTFRKGALPNGLTYYIKQNKTPKERASYYLVQNVGSVLETDQQNGLAHFLEHMAFNGTTTFPGNNMLGFLERNGVKFGKEVNAYTAHNETVYNISKVPTTNEKVIDSCLFILRDWCNELSLDEGEIDAERNIIEEEWRARLGLGTRIAEQTSGVKYNNTIYAKRPPIGSMDVVKTFDYQALRDFYNDWYRTDLQAIAIVGDINVDEVEKRVVELFSPIPAINNPKPRPFIAIPDNNTPQYVAVTDKEIRLSSVTLSIRHSIEQNNTWAEVKEKYLNVFFNTLINNRLKEKTFEKETPFTKAVIGNTDFVRGYEVFRISARAKSGKLKEAFEATYNELQRIINFGFTQGELERLKTTMLTSEKNKYNSRYRTSSDAYAQAIKYAYLNNTAISDPGLHYKMAQGIINGITLHDLQDYASKYLTAKNRFYVVEAPESEAATLPTVTNFETITKQAATKTLKPYVDKTPVETNLMPELPEAGKIVSTKILDAFNAEEWTLSNGAKVVYRFANYLKNSVALFAVSDGGLSLYDINDLPSATAASQYVERYGLADFGSYELRKMLAGKFAGTNFSINEYSETVTGSSSTKDVETMLQMLYLGFEEPRFDNEIYNDILEEKYEALDNKIETSKSILNDTYTKIVNNGDPRKPEADKAYLDQIDFDRVNTIYKERFSNAGDFTFFIVGDVKKDTIMPLVEQYIGAIKDVNRQETWVPQTDYYPVGNHQYNIKLKEDEPKATVLVKRRTLSGYTRKDVVYFSIMGAILDLRYKETIREKEGGAYGVSVQALSSKLKSVPPKTEMTKTLDISFVCNPDNAQYLKGLIYKELETIQKEVRQSDLDIVLENLKKNSENRTKTNNFWMSALKTYYSNGEDMTTTAFQEDILEHVTAKDIQKFAKRYLENADVLDFVFSPE